MGQREKALQPFALRFAEGFHFDPIIRSANHRTDGDEEQAQERMQLGALDARVVELAKVIGDRAGGLARNGKPPFKEA